MIQGLDAGATIKNIALRRENDYYIYIDRLPVEHIQIYGTQRTNGKMLRIEPNPGI